MIKSIFTFKIKIFFITFFYKLFYPKLFNQLKTIKKQMDSVSNQVIDSQMLITLPTLFI